jgi:hypothetical protein
MILALVRSEKSNKSGIKMKEGFRLGLKNLEDVFAALGFLEVDDELTQPVDAVRKVLGL